MSGKDFAAERAALNRELFWKRATGGSTEQIRYKLAKLAEQEDAQFPNLIGAFADNELVLQ